MENASKALLMAGGVLIAIIIISLLVKTYGNIGAFQRQQISAEEAERIEEYNKEYTKYINQYVYGTEVITVINKVKNTTDYDIKVNIKFTEEPYEYQVVDYENGKKTTKTITVGSGKELNIESDDDGNYSGDFIDENSGKFSNLKSRAFKCTEIGYDKYGRVNNIKFVEKPIT